MALAEIRAHELVRKAIHLSSSAIPLMYWFRFERDFMLKGVIIVALGFLTAEFLRFRSSTMKHLFSRVFGPALRQHEYKKLTGATYVFAGTVLTVFLFPKEIAVPALLILALSDTFAALVGIPFGKHPFLAKSMEGSAVFFIVSMPILMVFFPGQLIQNILVATILTITEAYPSNIDDNFLIPMVAGTSLSLAQLI